MKIYSSIHSLEVTVLNFYLSKVKCYTFPVLMIVCFPLLLSLAEPLPTDGPVKPAK